MSEKRFKLSKYVTPSSVSNFCDENGRMLNKEVVKVLNEQQATIEELKERLYDFEKRKIIEESAIDEDVIPKVKLLRTELFGEKYE